MEKTQLWSAGACSRFQSGGKPPHYIRAAVFCDESKLQCHTSMLTKQSHSSKQQPYKNFSCLFVWFVVKKILEFAWSAVEKTSLYYILQGCLFLSTLLADGISVFCISRLL